MYIGCLFKIYKACDVVFRGESWNPFVFMFIYAPLNVISNARIESARRVCHNVHIIDFQGRVEFPLSF